MNIFQPLLSILPITKTHKAPAGTFRPVRVSLSTQGQFFALMGFNVEARPKRGTPARLPVGVI
jgi:hypothetical protein